jgi:threonine dehydrogenase-like Zn-dependent dehydrogenase
VFQAGAEPSGSGTHGLTAMAHGVLLFRGEFSHRLAEPTHGEDRVVAEAAGAPGLARDAPFGDAFERLEDPAVGRGDNDDRPEPGCSLPIGHAFQLAEQQFDATPVVEPFAPVPRRLHSRTTAKSVDFDTGIVGEGEATGRPGGGTGLGGGVFEVGGPGLVDLERYAELGRSYDLVPGADEEAAEFGNLAGVVRRQDEARHGTSFAGARPALKPSGAWYRFAGYETSGGIGAMRAVVLRDGELRVEEVPRPEPGPGQVLAKVRACGICGSDLHAALYLPQLIEASRQSGGEWDERALTEGIVMGHEFVAEVAAAGPGAEGWAPGTRVTSMPVLIDPSAPRGVRAIGYTAGLPGAYSEYVLLSAPLLLPVPEGLSDEAAALTEPCAVGLHAVRQSGLQRGERVLIMGAGPIGLMTLLWAKHEGAGTVVVSEPSAARREMASRLGADIVVDPRTEELRGLVDEERGTPCTLVFECVGIEGTLQQAMDLAPRGGRVVVAGACMTEDRIRPLVGISKQLTLRFVLGYTPEEFAETLQALGAGVIDPTPMITRRIGLDELTATFRALADPAEGKVIVVPHG